MIPDLTILGGGVVGLSLADCALRHGLRVTVLDKGAMGQESSWAGAGMLTCRPGPRKNPVQPDIQDLILLSVELHAQWSKRLLEETGIDVGFRVCGAIELFVDKEDDQESTIQRLIEGCHQRQVRVRQISAVEARKLEPNLTADLVEGLEFPDEPQVRNPWFIRALIASIQKMGGRLIEGESVADLCVNSGKISGLILQNGQKIETGAVAVCAGAWTSLIPLLVKLVPASAKITPVRGQILCYQTDPNMARRLLTAGNHYIVPRGDGVILVGATHEKVGFNKETTEEGKAGLASFGARILPSLKNLEPVRTWAGLRPGMNGRHPLIGPVSGVKGLFMAAGHYRNGLTLAPATAEILMEMILEREPRISVKLWLH